MQAHGQDIQGFAIQALLNLIEENYGQQVLHDVVTAAGATLEDVRSPQAWFSLEFVETLLERALERCGDASLLDRMGESSISRRYLGFLYTFVRTFGSPEFAYGQVARSTPRFNKIGRYTIDALETGHAQLSYWPLDDAPRERTPHICRVRLAQLTAIPTLFDLPPATVTHAQCIATGNDACSYDLHWKPAQRRRAAWSSALVGLALSTTLCYALAPALPIALATVVASCLAGWSLGRNLELQHELQNRARALSEHHDALDRSMRTNEERFAELLEAKTEVERKVDQRTDELRMASRKLSDALSQLQDLDRAKTDFFNNVSHDLRSPLTLILAPLEDLVAGREPPGGTRVALAAMQRNADRLLNLINQLLDLAKIDAGAMTISPAPVQLVGLVRGITDGFAPSAAKKGVGLQLNAPELLVNVVLDATWIESAVTNLVANALRMTDPGGGVRIAIEDHGAEVAISVADDGPGIAREDHEKVFMRFAQGDSNRRMVGGTGIGLVLVREAARLHGGDVTLRSELGKGATFTVRLPRKPAGMASIAPPGSAAPPLTLPPRASAEALVPAASAERAGPAPNAPLALVVEDNPELLQFMADVLAVRYRVHAASNGQEALAKVLDAKPDVIISDVAMDVMDGYQLCRALRAAEETRTVPVLLVTARADISSVLTGFEAGANDYVLKPFHGRELLARVDVHVRVRRMVQELALQERHAMLGVLAASVAHQVRNPLTSLVSGLPAMRKRVGPKIDQPSLELMDVMIECAERIERLTQDLLDLSRVDREEGGKYRPSDGLRAALRLFRTRAGEGVNIEDDVETSEIIEGRVGDMNHVFMNLLDNALRAIGERGTIRVHGKIEGGYYVTSIEDSGPGIDEEVAQRIFEPFFTTREAGQGTGLGLAIARQVVNAAGGTIEVGRSELDGAVFKVRIPLTRRETLQAAALPNVEA